MNSIWDSLRLFQNNALALAKITLPFILILEIFESYYIEYYLTTAFQTNDFLPLLVAHLTIKPFYSIAIVLYISAIISQQPLSITQTWGQSLQYWPVYFVLSLMTNFIIGAGALFYVLPGLYAFVCFSFAEFYLLIERQSPLTALKSSCINTRKYFLILTLGFIVFAIFIFYSHSLVYTIFDLQSPKINRELLEQMLQQSSSPNSQVLDQNQALIEYPEFSLFKSVISIIFNFLAIIFTIFAFRVYRLTKDEKV